RRRHTRSKRDWSSDVCSSDLFVFHGKKYASLEGFWQMMKYPEGSDDPRAKFPGIEWKYTRAQVAQMVSFEANHAGALASENMTKIGRASCREREEREEVGGRG